MTQETLRVPTWIHRIAMPLFLVAICPPAVFIFWYTATHLDGSFIDLWKLMQIQGIGKTFFDIWIPVAFGSAKAWKIIGIFAAFQLLLMRVVPGKPFLGPITPMGNVPLYKANGLACFGITMGTFWLASHHWNLFPATILYDELGPILGALNTFSLIFCLFLYAKGILRPSSTDASSSGNPLFDYYWGTELYPRVWGWDIKQFTNCRFGMMSWGLLLLSYAAKQKALYGFVSDAMAVSVALQLLYVAKFFLWETGYLRSLDIMHDRAGFYICWGCLVWVPSIYTSPGLYLVHHPIQLGTPLAAAIFFAGVASIAANYLADRQRQVVRALQGNCRVWGRTPILIRAPYKTETGEPKETLLLASGWWGLSRHFHYLPEIGAAFFWSLPALFFNFLPYFYVSFLTILLVDRAFRHDKRCEDKYGPAWAEYCRRVPYKLVPFLY